MNHWYGYYQRLARKTRKYRYEKTVAAHYYHKLAALAPDPHTRALLLKFTADEKASASALGRLYHQLTGKSAPGHPTPSLGIPLYLDGLQQRVLAESTAFLHYGDEFLNAPDHYLRSFFYKLGAVAIQHSLCLCSFLARKETGLKD